MKKFVALVCISIFCISVHAQKKIKPHQLVFEGGGIRGLAYAGALQQLDSLGMRDSVTAYAGTSAGAITAMCCALGYSSRELDSIVAAMPLRDWKDGKGAIAMASRVGSKYGLYKGDAFLLWLQKIIEYKTGNGNITFEALQKMGYPALYIMATSMTQQKSILFCASTFPNMKVKDAVRASMSIPMYFASVAIDANGNVLHGAARKNAKHILVDGGVISNFPITIFDTVINGARHPNQYTLGMRLDTDQQIALDTSGAKALAYMPITGLKSYVKSLYNLLLETNNRAHLQACDWDRTISISTLNMGPTIKNLSQEQRQKLVNSGKQGVRLYVARRERTVSS